MSVWRRKPSLYQRLCSGCARAYLHLSRGRSAIQDVLRSGGWRQRIAIGCVVPPPPPPATAIALQTSRIQPATTPDVATTHQRLLMARVHMKCIPFTWRFDVAIVSSSSRPQHPGSETRTCRAVACGWRSCPTQLRPPQPPPSAAARPAGVPACPAPAGWARRGVPRQGGRPQAAAAPCRRASPRCATCEQCTWPALCIPSVALLKSVPCIDWQVVSPHGAADTDCSAVESMRHTEKHRTCQRLKTEPYGCIWG